MVFEKTPGRPGGLQRVDAVEEMAMEMTGRVAGRSLGAAVLLLAMAGGRGGGALQRNNPPPNPSPSYPSSLGSNNSGNLPVRTSTLDDQPELREMEEKRGRAANSERQKMMLKEANQLVQAAADLQVSVTRGIEGAGREEQAKRAEAIEKLAKDVKERMKGSR